MTGDHPDPDWCTPSPSHPSILGMLGPHRSISSTPTVTSSFCARHLARLAVTVDFPTPPFPDNTSTLCLTPASLSAMIAMSGSGSAGPAAAHTVWLGHPAHECARCPNQTVCAAA